MHIDTKYSTVVSVCLVLTIQFPWTPWGRTYTSPQLIAMYRVSVRFEVNCINFVSISLSLFLKGKKYPSSGINDKTHLIKMLELLKPLTFTLIR